MLPGATVLTRMPARRELERHRLRRAAQRRLGRRVGTAAGLGPLAQDRGRCSRSPRRAVGRISSGTAARAHEERPDQVDLEHLRGTRAGSVSCTAVDGPPTPALLTSASQPAERVRPWRSRPRSAGLLVRHVGDQADGTRSGPSQARAAAASGPSGRHGRALHRASDDLGSQPRAMPSPSRTGGAGDQRRGARSRPRLGDRPGGGERDPRWSRGRGKEATRASGAGPAGR